MTRALLPLAFVLSLALVFTACDSAEPEPEPTALALGEGSVNLFGASSRSFSGQAFFTLVEGDGSPVFVVGVVQGRLEDAREDNVEVVAVGGLNARPAPGSYTLGDPLQGETAYAGVYVRSTQNLEHYAFSQSGSLTVETSTADAVQGTLRVDGELRGTGSGTVSARAHFHAGFVDADDLPDVIQVETRAAALRLAR